VHGRNISLPPVALELQVGCCPDPIDDGTGSIRYQLHGLFFKGARNLDGTPEDPPSRSPARNHVTDRAATLHNEIAQLKTRIDNLQEERDNYRTANEVFARVLHALTIENGNLRRSTGRSRAAHLTVIDPARHRPTD
jgi:hypothetical protein